MWGGSEGPYEALARDPFVGIKEDEHAPEGPDIGADDPRRAGEIDEDCSETGDFHRYVGVGA